MSTAKFDTWKNTDDTENFKVRAWVNFNGTGTVAIRAAGNVGSITDNAAGDYTVNITAAMPDANGCVIATPWAGSNAATGVEQVSFAVGAVRFRTILAGVGPVDFNNVHVAIVR